MVLNTAFNDASLTIGPRVRFNHINNAKGSRKAPFVA